MLLYVRLSDDESPPDIGYLNPYKALVVLEETVPYERQKLISRWLVNTGCLYMMAWGPKCSSWDDSVDIANLENFDFGEIPDDSFVMTTWHEDQPLADVFYYAKHNAFHPTKELPNMVIVHLAAVDKGVEFKNGYSNA
jgi:hypothetical protein